MPVMIHSRSNYSSNTTSDNYTGAGIVLGTTFGLVLLFIALVIIINKKCMKPQKTTIALPMDTTSTKV